ncbi:fungal-specific transcription factor domain-containing protein [Spinellus fusiger]|nr:fungal-specific transcription factor domain-containing protein [Spinellus fusiger]
MNSSVNTPPRLNIQTSQIRLMPSTHSPIQGRVLGASLLPTSFKALDIRRAKRKRAKHSCDMCRKKKTRCDAENNRPCTMCTTANTECQFLLKQKKRGPAAGVYVEALESRLKRMESLLEKMPRLKIDSPTIEDLAKEEDFSRKESVSDEEVHTSSTHSTENIHTPYTASTLKENMIIDYDLDESENTNVSRPQSPLPQDCSSSLMKQSNNYIVTDYGRTYYVGSSSGIHHLDTKMFISNKQHPLSNYPSWIVQKIDTNEDLHIMLKASIVNGNPPVLEVLKHERLALFKDVPDMTQELADFAVHRYFTCAHEDFPVINKLSFLEQYYFHNPSPPDIYLLHTICGIGIHVLQVEFESGMHPCSSLTINGVKSLYDRMMEKAREVMSIAHKRSRISTVQTLALITLFGEKEDTSINATPFHWFSAGMAIRMAQDLGLHISSPEWHIPSHEVELRKRIWFGLYSIDRWLSAKLGRPITILDSDITLDLPSLYEVDCLHHTDTEKELGMVNFKPSLMLDAEKSIKEKRPVYSNFVHFITLSQILGQILNKLHSSQKPSSQEDHEPDLIPSIERKLYNWTQSLPEEMQRRLTIPDPLPVGSAILVCGYHCTVLLLYQCIITDESEIKSPLYPHAIEACTLGAQIIMEMSEIIHTEIKCIIPWGIVPYSIFHAAIVFFTLLKSHDSRTRNNGRQGLIRCSIVLKENDNTFSLVSKRIAEMLHALVKDLPDSNDLADTEACNSETGKSGCSTTSPMTEDTSIGNIIESMKDPSYQKQMLESIDTMQYTEARTVSGSSSSGDSPPHYSTETSSTSTKVYLQEIETGSSSCHSQATLEENSHGMPGSVHSSASMEFMSPQNMATTTPPDSLNYASQSAFFYSPTLSTSTDFILQTAPEFTSYPQHTHPTNPQHTNNTHANTSYSHLGQTTGFDITLSESVSTHPSSVLLNLPDGLTWDQWSVLLGSTTANEKIKSI